MPGQPPGDAAGGDSLRQLALLTGRAFASLAGHAALPVITRGGRAALEQAGDIEAAGYGSHLLGGEFLGPVEGVVDGGGHQVL